MPPSGWEVGSHTCSHPRLSALDDSAVESELVESRRVCEEQMGSACRSIAYPYSDYDARSVRAAEAAGYEFAVSVPRAAEEPRPLEWPRVGVYHGEGAIRIVLRAWSRRLPPSAAVRAALAVRRVAGR